MHLTTLRHGTAWARKALAGLAVGCAAGFPAHAGDVVCGPPDARGAQACEAALPEALVRQMAGVQEQSHWCWAASMEMLLARYGVRLSQRAIVSSHHGSAVNLRLPTADIPRVLERDWAAESGARFTVRAMPQADASAGPLPISASLALAALQDDHPLLLAARGHVVVLVGITFTRYRDARFLRVTGGTVIDPRASAGLRPLASEEMEPDYLGWAAVTPVEPAVHAAALAWGD